MKITELYQALLTDSYADSVQSFALLTDNFNNQMNKGQAAIDAWRSFQEEVGTEAWSEQEKEEAQSIFDSMVEAVPNVIDAIEEIHDSFGSTLEDV